VKTEIPSPVKLLSTTTLSVSKEATGVMADKTKQFTFTATFYAADGSTPLASGTAFTYTGATLPGTTGATPPAGGTLTLDSQGKASFQLKHGQSITIGDAPVGGFIEVAEAPDANYATHYEDSAAPGTTVGALNTGLKQLEDTPRAFAFTNARLYTPPTGLGPSGEGLPLALAAIAGLLAFLAIRAAHRRWARAGGR
jgi:hypothetical protein